MKRTIEDAMKTTIEQINKRFAPSRDPDGSFRPMPIKLLDDEVTFKLHWAVASSQSRAQSIGRVLRVDDFPRCPSCHAECCLGHPDNGCEMYAVWDVSES